MLSGHYIKEAVMKVFLLIIVTVVPLIALSLAIYKAIIKKKQNNPILANIILIAIISLLILFPAVIFFIDTEGLAFFMVIIIEYLLLSVLIPWSILIVIVLFVVRKVRLNPTKTKTAVCIVFILLLTAIVCFGTFSGAFVNAMNWIIGGPPIP